MKTLNRRTGLAVLVAAVALGAWSVSAWAQCCGRRQPTSSDVEKPAAKAEASSCTKSQQLCADCGEVKGSKACCDASAVKCAKCGLAKGSPGCRKVGTCSTKATKSCEKAGASARGESCKSEKAEKCEGCGKTKGSAGCCK